jgi:hypothetical protein
MNTGTVSNGNREAVRMHKTQSEDTFHINTEEYDWGLDFVRGIE